MLCAVVLNDPLLNQLLKHRETDAGHALDGNEQIVNRAV